MRDSRPESGPLDRLRKLDREIHLMQHVIGLLQWDQETYMPEGAVAERSEQLALLEGQAHERQTSPEMGELIAAGEARTRPRRNR